MKQKNYMMKRYLPPPSKIFKSFRLRGKEFLRENTLHGFPYFVDPNRPLWERIVWFLCTAASIGAAIGIILTIMEKFQTDPTLTGVDTQTEEMKLEFPAIILCQIDQKFNFGKYQADSKHFDAMYRWDWAPIKDSLTVNFGKETYSQLFYRLTPECTDLYENCTYGEVSKPCEKLFKKVLITRGICCVIPATRITKESRPWEVSFDTRSYPISVDIIETNGIPPRREVVHNAYEIETSTTIDIVIEYTYSTEAMAYLPMKQRRCLFPSEFISYNVCYNSCQKSKILDVCKCVPWYFSSLDNNNDECKRADYNCLAGNASTLREPHCHCYLPCNHTAYQFSMVSMRTDNRVKIQISNWPSVVFKREVKFGWLDLLVSFGGIAGLFVGYSLLTTFELAYYLTLRSYCGAVLDASDKTIKTKAPKPKRIKVIDLKKDYYDYVH